MLIFGAIAILATTVTKKCYCDLKNDEKRADMNSERIKSAELCCKDIDIKRKLVDDGGKDTGTSVKKYCPVKGVDEKSEERIAFANCCRTKYVGKLDSEDDQDVEKANCF